MKGNDKDSAIPKKERSATDKDYPDVIMPVGGEEGLDEENPMAYSLLSKIEDPYNPQANPGEQTQTTAEDGIPHILPADRG